jgi:tRNA dimethylallyltransferase
MQPSKKLLVVAGPTSSGKSSLAVSLALELGGEIVNCDAMQMYRRMEIGTAKPTLEQRAAVPHHLYDTVEPDDYYDAGRYMVEARRVCEELGARGQVPVVVGGTGLYLRALLEGLFAGPGRSGAVRERLRRVGESRGRGYLYRLLQRRDPVAASRIQPGDSVRIVRALEIYFTTGRPITELQPSRQPLERFSVIKLGLNVPREQLYDRINRRVAWMFEAGLVREVENLLEQGYSPDSKGFEALGYRHAVAFLRGGLSLEEAIELTSRDTRRYAKRQMTWFRKEKDIQWIGLPGDEPEALLEALRVFRRRAEIQAEERRGNGV